MAISEGTEPVPAQSNKPKGAPPVAKVQVGGIHAAIWRSITDKGAFYSVTFEKRYKNDQGAWTSTDFYSQLDMLAITKACDIAYADIAELRARDKAAGQREPGEEG